MAPELGTDNMTEEDIGVINSNGPEDAEEITSVDRQREHCHQITVSLPHK